ncbi:riboflavin transporter Mch5p [Trichomonascus vanleenenianus]|uniref:MCT family MFS transporter n=1 Tax=Trichomonascus vanleenenianus TaxID=2268995 RepID=UPI003ECBAC4E
MAKETACQDFISLDSKKIDNLEEGAVDSDATILASDVNLHLRKDKKTVQFDEPLELKKVVSVVNPNGGYTETTRPVLERDNSNFSAIASEDDEEESSHPDGGWMAWRVVLGSFFGLTAVFGIMNSLGALQAYIGENQLSNLSSSKVSWIFSIYSFICFFFCNVSGQLFDSYGPYHLMAVGSILHVFSLFMMSLCTEFYQFVLAFGIGAGFGASLCMTPLVAIVGHWFNRNRGSATGAASIGGSFGGLVFPVMLRSLYSKVGFGWAIRCLAFISMTALILSMLLIRPRLARKRFKLKPGNIVDLGTFRDKRFIYLQLMTLTVEVALLNGITFLPSFCIAQGMSQTNSYVMLTIVSAMGIPGRYIAGVAADKYGRYNTMTAFLLLAFLSIFVVWLPFGSKYAAMMVFSVVYGFAAGTVMSLTPVCVGQICKTEDYGKRYGTVYTICGFAPLFGIPLSGLLIRGTNYNGLVVVCGALYFTAFAFILATRYCCVGWKLVKF